MVLISASGCSRSDQPGPAATSPPTARVAPGPGPGATTNRPPGAAALAESVSPEQLEVNYLQAPDVPAKIDILDDLGDAEPGAAVAVLSRLFFYERDHALQEEILNQLVYINGAEAAKIELLSDAVKTNQAASVRYAAIEVMVEGGDPSAVVVLQPVLHDPDPGLRDAAADAIEELKSGK